MRRRRSGDALVDAVVAFPAPLVHSRSMATKRRTPKRKSKAAPKKRAAAPRRWSGGAARAAYEGAYESLQQAMRDIGTVEKSYGSAPDRHETAELRRVSKASKAIERAMVILYDEAYP